jgi:hypothetical protein
MLRKGAGRVQGGSSRGSHPVRLRLVKAPRGGALSPFLAARDVWRGLDCSLSGGGGSGVGALARMALGLLIGWWIYVPVHELLHAAACRAAGGTVSRLEIAPLYGGALLARFLPFVVAGGSSGYAGRLSGFDTKGSDLIYLATDLGPFVLTVLPGVWALRRAARALRPLAFGLLLSVALAPFLSLGGDAYEIGSILVTRLPPWSDAVTRGLLRGDDLAARIASLATTVEAPWGGLALAAALGLAWALLTYALAGAVATTLGEPPLAAVPA